MSLQPPLVLPGTSTEINYYLWDTHTRTISHTLSTPWAVDSYLQLMLWQKLKGNGIEEEVEEGFSVRRSMAVLTSYLEN